MSSWDPFSSGTNVWDTLSDVVKIGVPVILTAFITWRATKSARAHEIDRERRKSRRELLERVGGKFEECQNRVVVLTASLRTVTEMLKPERYSEEKLKVAKEIADGAHTAYMAAIGELENHQIILTLSGFDDSEDALSTYTSTARQLVGHSFPPKDETDKDAREKARSAKEADWLSASTAFRDTLISHYKQL